MELPKCRASDCTETTFSRWSIYNKVAESKVPLSMLPLKRDLLRTIFLQMRSPAPRTVTSGHEHISQFPAISVGTSSVTYLVKIHVFVLHGQLPILHVHRLA